MEMNEDVSNRPAITTHWRCNPSQEGEVGQVDHSQSAAAALSRELPNFPKPKQHYGGPSCAALAELYRRS